MFLMAADMAPRKRTTKQRKNSPKTAKLEAFLEDFDSEGKNNIFCWIKHSAFMGSGLQYFICTLI